MLPRARERVTDQPRSMGWTAKAAAIALIVLGVGVPLWVPRWTEGVLGGRRGPGSMVWGEVEGISGGCASFQSQTEIVLCTFSGWSL